MLQFKDVFFNYAGQIEVVPLLAPRKFKGGICCGSHLAVTYGANLLYLQIFFVPTPAKQA